VLCTSLIAPLEAASSEDSTPLAAASLASLCCRREQARDPSFGYCASASPLCLQARAGKRPVLWFLCICVPLCCRPEQEVDVNNPGNNLDVPAPAAPRSTTSRTTSPKREGGPLCFPSQSPLMLWVPLCLPLQRLQRKAFVKTSRDRKGTLRKVVWLVRQAFRFCCAWV